METRNKNEKTLIVGTYGDGTRENLKSTYYWTGNGWSKTDAWGYKSKAGLNKALRRALDTGRFTGNNIRLETI